MALTARGEAAIDGARGHRAALGERLGPRRVEATSRLLGDIVPDLGADAAVRGRRVRAPR